MNRQDFMNRLAGELSRLPKEEIQAAMEFYNEYFDEAGPDNEAAAVKELGSPAKVATQIKADYAVKQLDENHGKQTTRKGLNAILWVILGIFAAPIAFPLAIALGAVVFAIFITIISVAVSLLVGFGAICIAGIAMIIMGIVGLAGSFAGGLLLIGIGLMTTAVMALLCVGVFVATREIIRAIAKQARRSNEVRKMKKVVKEEHRND